MTSSEIQIAHRFLARSAYYLGTEYPAKLRAAVEAIPDDRLWWRPNPEANSVANLLLHLDGNLRQWVISGIGGAPDVRQREGEFAATEGAEGGALMHRLDATCTEAVRVIEAIRADDLLSPRVIQGRETQVLSALYHAVEHFSGHVGQIIVMAKWFSPGSLAFYASGSEGLAGPTFLPEGVHDID
jgi:uncharacterized damage-inducible protein DinB